MLPAPGGALPRGIVASVAGALLLAVLSTAGDFVWAQFRLPHRVVYGLAHGGAIFLALGGYLGMLRGRAWRGALGGLSVGVGAAASFYALAPLLGYAAMFVSWMAVWLGFAVLDGRVLLRASHARWLARGLLAALLSGLAFYAISGIWTQPRPGGPDYVVNLASWTLAFLPGLCALLLGEDGQDPPR